MCAPPLPRLQWQFFNIPFSPFKELFKGPGGHVFCYKYYLREERRLWLWMLDICLINVMYIHTLGLSLCVSVQYRWNLTMFGCSNCVRFSNTNWIFSSCDLKFFLSENWTSFHTTSTPSSVSIAKWAQSIPGTSRCSTCWLSKKEKCK